MLAALNHLVEAVEEAAAKDADVAAVATVHGTTEHHLRRMFSSLAGCRCRSMYAVAECHSQRPTSWSRPTTC